MFDFVQTTEHNSLECDFNQNLVTFFQNNTDLPCFEVKNGILETGYFIGIDWINQDYSKAIYVCPKLDNEFRKVDFFKMFFTYLSSSSMIDYVHLDSLYELKVDKPFIEIHESEDIITPLLAIYFLKILKTITKKGLKKSYYIVQKNLNSRVKGKVLVGRNIKVNLLRNDITKSFCQYEEFGLNNPENKFLKTVFMFVIKYLNSFKEFKQKAQPDIEYSMPSFELIDEIQNAQTIKNFKRNAFYKEYSEAIKIGNLLLKRFGYNLKNTVSNKNDKILTPPFWINMPQLFELYVLGLLRNKFGDNLLFQSKGNYGNPDFLLKGDTKAIIDAKYKNKYAKQEYWIEDIRQLSGYARDKAIMNSLNANIKEIIDCIIIYPSQVAPKTLPSNLKERELLGFIQFYKIGISLPEIHY